MNSIELLNTFFAGLLQAAVLIPLFISLGLLFLPMFMRRWVDFLGIIAVTFPLVAMIVLWANFAPAANGYAFVSSVPLGLEALGARMTLGLNAISMPMFALTALVGFAAGLYTLGHKNERRGLLWSLILMIEAGTLGAFASVDLFYAFLFHEVGLLPTFLAIAIFGGQGRRQAAIESGVFMLAGSLAMLVGLLLFYNQVGIGSFNLIELRTHLAANPISAELHKYVWGFLLLGAAILVGLWPFYSWVPKLLTCAPTPVAMLHAGALKVFGIYFMIQGFAGWTHWGVVEFGSVASVLAVGNLLLLGMAAMAQTDLKRLISYAALMHVGTFVLGVKAYTYESITGVVVLMFGAGLSSALMFLLAGALKRRTGTLEMANYGGLRQATPILGTFLMIGFMSMSALPCFVGFWGELGILMGAFRSLPWPFLAILVGLIITATFSLRALQTMLMGAKKPSGIFELSLIECWACWLLVLPMILLAVFPSVLTFPISQLLPSIFPFRL